jgi:hypothetical protein
MAQSPEALEERRERMRALLALTSLTKTERLREAERMGAAYAKDRDAVASDLALMAEGWRDLLLAQAGLGEMAVNPQILPGAVPYTIEEIADTLGRLEMTAQALRANVNARLVFEALLLAMPGPV